MSPLTGLLCLIGLNLYISTLAYTLRIFSRSRLTDELGDEARAERVLAWLDKREQELQVTFSFARLCSNVSVLFATIAVLGAPVVGTDWMSMLLPASVAIALLLVCHIGVSHALAVHSGEVILARTMPVVSALAYLLWPFSTLAMAIDFIVRRLLGKGHRSEEEESERAEEEILDAVSEGMAIGAVDEEQQEMIEAIFNLHDTSVSAIMTPRTDIDAIEASADFETVRKLAVEAGHSRMPVIEESIDEIIGVLYVKDLLRLEASEGFTARSLIRNVPYVPETKTIDALLREFRQTKVHIAIVLDEYGGTAGLVTIEDILEELVGEIDDEYDESTPEPIQRVDADTLEVDARVPVREINEEFDVDEDQGIPEDGDYETIGGFVFTQLGKIPQAGETVDHADMHIVVISAEERKINRLRISRSAPRKQSA